MILRIFFFCQCYFYLDVTTMILRRTWAVHWVTGIHSLQRNCSRLVFIQETTFNSFNKGFFLFLASSSAIKMFNMLKSEGAQPSPPPSTSSVKSIASREVSSLNGNWTPPPPRFRKKKYKPGTPWNKFLSTPLVEVSTNISTPDSPNLLLWGPGGVLFYMNLNSEN